MKINDLIKHRSVTACMKEAYSLMTGNVKNLLKSTWWAFMIYAFMVAFMVYLRTPNKMLHDWGEENMMLSFCLQTVVYLGAIVAAFLMGAAAWRWLTDKPFGRMMKRFTTIYLASAVVSFVVTFAATFCPNLLLPYGISHSLRLGCYDRFGSRLALAPHHRALCTRHRRCHRPLHGGESAFRLSHSQIHVAGKG